jgi:hypothetical protein
MVREKNNPIFLNSDEIYSRNNIIISINMTLREEKILVYHLNQKPLTLNHQVCKN